MRKSDFAIVLPVRYRSSRFPGKPLAMIAGRPLIEWVYEKAKRVKGVGKVIVATDDESIMKAVEGFGGKSLMTSKEHRTGTDRVGEVAALLQEEIIVNLQGDEPVFPDGLVEKMVDVIRSDGKVDVVTACHPIDKSEELENPNVVKVVMDNNGYALYFSRSPIPYGAGGELGDEEKPASGAYRHIGIYVFKRSALLRFVALKPAKLERSERLEQLRALANGMKVRLVVCSESTIGIDVPADIKKVERFLAKIYNHKNA